MKKILIIVFVVLAIVLAGCQGFTVSYTGDYCEDGIQDRDEEDVDCGGQYCDACDETGTDDTDEPSGEAPYNAATTDSDEDGVMDSEDVCPDEDDTIDDNGNDIADCTEVVPTVVCVEDDGGNQVYDAGITTVVTTYSGGTSSTATYTDVCTENALTEYACADEQFISEVAVTCVFGCAADGTGACAEGPSADTDGDGLTDDEENNTYGTNALYEDSDNDGLSDYAEVMTYFTNPMEADTDSDGLRDDKEVLVQLTDPNDTDTDDDNYSDYDEVQGTFGDYTNPNDAESYPITGSCSETDGVTTVTVRDETGAETTTNYMNICYNYDDDDATDDSITEYSCDGVNVVETSSSCAYGCENQTACAEAPEPPVVGSPTTNSCTETDTNNCGVGLACMDTGTCYVACSPAEGCLAGYTCDTTTTPASCVSG